jgi:fatty-acid desaturase
VTLCLGHTIGLHRLLIHRSFQCPLWLERLLVHLGTVVGMGGPVQMLYQHDVRDWGQRQAACHAYLTDQAPFWQDAWWQLHCKLELDHGPQFQVEERVAGSSWYQFTQRWWMLQQLPWAVLLYVLGGWGFVIWGISVRIVVSLTGHWLVGWLVHRYGERSWHLEGHAVQGYNFPALGLLAMGEAWHNNHHAFPGSARLGILPAQPDPGWWALQTLASFGLVWGLRQPEDMPHRPELNAL